MQRIYYDKDIKDAAADALHIYNGETDFHEYFFFAGITWYRMNHFVEADNSRVWCGVIVGTIFGFFMNRWFG